jgi:predicted Zn-ribbon and HTH transcriptional regulator
MPNLLKIGFTTRNVDERITELNSSTGVPTNFVLEAYFCSSTPENDERLLHRELNEYRTNRNREFFQISILDAIEKIKNILEKPPDLLGENGQAEFQQKEIKRQEEIKKRENISSYIYANDPGGNIVKYSILCVSCGKQFFSSQLVHGSTKCPHCFKTYNNRICLL